MPEYIAPGVYVEEIESGPKPIEGVATSTAAFIGETERGPVKPQLVTSYNQYARLFGSVFADGQYMPYAVNSFFENGGTRAYIARILATDALTGKVAYEFLDIQANGPGDWSNRLYIKISDGTTQGQDGQPSGLRIQVAYWQAEHLPNSVIQEGDQATDPFFPDSTLLPRPDIIEDFDDINLLDPQSPSHFTKILNDSALIRVNPPISIPNAGDNLKLPLIKFEGGANGSDIKITDYQNDQEQNLDKWQGLQALTLDSYREVALVYAPDAKPDVVKKVINHCENQKFRFAVIDAPQGSNANSLDPRSDNDSQYAAFYYPWISISDPRTGVRQMIPPGGAVLGIYARTDADRGVFKAPANEVVLGALDVEYHITAQTQDTLNPRGINVIRQFTGRGIRVWGARTLSSDPSWKYVPVRRLFIFLEKSIYEGTQWVVFEPNDDRLWARVTDTIRLFLRELWRNGGLMGATENQAFFVTCDRSTMTQDDIINGRLICQIGVAPIRPAEFVIFQIFQTTADAQN